jgi:prefoldin subunit 5
MSETKPIETKPSEVKPRKVVGRNIAIALGIVCILLITGLGGAMAYYTMTISDKNNTIDSINAQLHSITGNNTSANATEIINELNANITNLTNEKSQLQTWLAGNITSYEAQISSLNVQITRLQTWLSNNITAYNSLQSTYSNYVNNQSHTNAEYQNLQNTISSLNTQITSLQSQIANLQAPDLIKVNLKSDDNHPFLGQENLHVYGEICNVGTNTAYNSKLHVVGYQSGGVVAFDTYILEGIISGHSWTSVDGAIPYNGGSLTSWTITLQWTNS